MSERERGVHTCLLHSKDGLYNAIKPNKEMKNSISLINTFQSVIVPNVQPITGISFNISCIFPLAYVKY